MRRSKELLKKRRKAIVRWLLAGFLVFILLVFLCNVWIVDATREKIFTSDSTIKANKVGLVLGTSKKRVDGTPNLFFKYRMQAVAQLFLAGKINHIIVSGDNSVMEYDEANDMRKALVKLGIPDSSITMDYAGFRTLDSVVRSKEVFGQDSITIITQRFQLERALFIANRYKMHAIGYAAQDVPNEYSVKTTVREYFAKCVAVLDLYVLNTHPKFLGEKVEMRISN